MFIYFSQGFQVLVEREWLEFGHKFADRCGNGVNSEDPNERSPVFLQWLDCVYQLFKQFPCAFQFNEAYLVIECQFHWNKYTLTMNSADNIFFYYKVYMLKVQYMLCLLMSENFALQIKMVQHTYSHLFGTFLCNTARERLQGELSVQTSSLWSLLHPSNSQFYNHLYSPSKEQQVNKEHSLVMPIPLKTLNVFLKNFWMVDAI